MIRAVRAPLPARKEPASPRLVPVPMPFILRFDAISRADVSRVGGKGANLGEMLRAGLPVPSGFVVTVDAYRRFYEASGLQAEIGRRVKVIDLDDPERLRVAAQAIQTLIRRAPMPDDVRGAILGAYGDLMKAEPDAHGLVAVRSSATIEDSAEFSFAGMFDSYLNVSGPEDLVRRVRDCWASSYGARVLYYRLKQGLPAELLIGVVVQRMINSEKSGVMFTVNPATKDASRLVIEAAFGLGEAVVGGQVTPDHYEIVKEAMQVADQRSARKKCMRTRDPQSRETMRIPLDETRGKAPALSGDEVRAVAGLGIRDEQLYGAPQDIEFAIEGSQIVLAQTRPMTTLGTTATIAGDARDSAASRAVLEAIRAIIAECRRLGITSSICGQAPSVHPDYVAHLVRWGSDAVSDNADVIDATRHNITFAERQLLLDAARRTLS